MDSRSHPLTKKNALIVKSAMSLVNSTQSMKI